MPRPAASAAITVKPRASAASAVGVDEGVDIVVGMRPAMQVADAACAPDIATEQQEDSRLLDPDHAADPVGDPGNLSRVLQDDDRNTAPGPTCSAPIARPPTRFAAGAPAPRAAHGGSRGSRGWRRGLAAPGGRWEGQRRAGLHAVAAADHDAGSISDISRAACPELGLRPGVVGAGAARDALPGRAGWPRPPMRLVLQRRHDLGPFPPGPGVVRVCSVAAT